MELTGTDVVSSSSRVGYLPVYDRAPVMATRLMSSCNCRAASSPSVHGKARPQRSGAGTRVSKIRCQGLTLTESQTVAAPRFEAGFCAGAPQAGDAPRPTRSRARCDPRRAPGFVRVQARADQRVGAALLLARRERPVPRAREGRRGGAALRPGRDARVGQDGVRRASPVHANAERASRALHARAAEPRHAPAPIAAGQHVDGRAPGRGDAGPHRDLDRRFRGESVHETAVPASP